MQFKLTPSAVALMVASGFVAPVNADNKSAEALGFRAVLKMRGGDGEKGMLLSPNASLSSNNTNITAGLNAGIDAILQLHSLSPLPSEGCGAVVVDLQHRLDNGTDEWIVTFTTNTTECDRAMNDLLLSGSQNNNKDWSGNDGCNNQGYNNTGNNNVGNNNHGNNNVGDNNVGNNNHGSNNKGHDNQGSNNKGNNNRGNHNIGNNNDGNDNAGNHNHGNGHHNNNKKHGYSSLSDVDGESNATIPINRQTFIKAYNARLEATETTGNATSLSVFANKSSDDDDNCHFWVGFCRVTDDQYPWACIALFAASCLCLVLVCGSILCCCCCRLCCRQRHTTTINIHHDQPPPPGTTPEKDPQQHYVPHVPLQQQQPVSHQHYHYDHNEHYHYQSQKDIDEPPTNGVAIQTAGDDPKKQPPV